MIRCNLPVHPRTGLTAVGIVNGKAVWPILGGAPSRLEEIDTRLDAVRAEILEIQELPEPTDDDIARTDVLLDEREALTGEREPLAARAARIEAVRAAVESTTGTTRVDSGTFTAPQVLTRTNPFENVDQIARSFSFDNKIAPEWDDDVVARAVTALTDYRGRGVTDEAVQNAVETVENVPGAAQYAIIHGSPAYRSAFTAWLRSQGNPILDAEQQDAVRTAMSLTGGNGGYALPTLFDPTLIKTGTLSKNDVRRVSRVVTGTQNVWHGVSTGAVTAYWTAEAAAMTEGSPALSNPSVTAFKMTGFLLGSYEIFEDSNLLSELPPLIGEAFTVLENEAFANGTGSTSPNGIVATIAAVSGDTITCTTRGTFAAGDLINLQQAIPTRYEDSSTFYANKATYNLIRQFSTSSVGSYFWADLNPGTPPNLLGDSYLKASNVTASTASGTAFMVYGDFSQYLIYDRIGMQVEFVQNYFNSSALPTGQRALVAHKRVGAGVTDTNAFRYLKG